MLYFTLFLLAVFAIAYLLGAVAFSVLLARAFGLPDPRSYGSGNAGATNVARSGNKTAALLTLALDMGKGAAAVALVLPAAASLGFELGEAQAAVAVAVAGTAAVVGHIFSCFLRMRGGRGVATAFGVYLAWGWVLAAGVAAVWLFVFALWRYSSLASLAAAASAVVLFAAYGSGAVAVSAGVIGVLIFYRHKDNICRLLHGQETPLTPPPG